MRLLDGKRIAQEIQEEIRKQVMKISSRKPTLALLLVGDNPSSQVYVRAKKKACRLVGIESIFRHFPSSLSASDLIAEITSLNQDPQVDGILVQLPLPSHIYLPSITSAIDPSKDVDGFHPENMGRLLLGENKGFVPCTPLGIQTLLERENLPVAGKHVVILGRSNIVGKPLAALLMQKGSQANATVTLAHSQSRNISSLLQSADILVAAMGKPQAIGPEHLCKEAIVIDVGINRSDSGHLVGDVDFEKVAPHVQAITPVPGGIGPMTIAMLLQNTLKSFFTRLPQ